MMTPQEVEDHAFSKATLGGYNMAMVDEFLDLLTEDYTALYNDNAILKNKLKVLSDTVEEYRATDTAIRKTLLAAQQMAESMVSDAEKKKEDLIREAEESAKSCLNDLKKQIADEEYRLQKAKECTAIYVRDVRAAYSGALDYLGRLDELCADVALTENGPSDDDISANINGAPNPEEKSPSSPDPDPIFPDPYSIDPEATRRFESLQFGKDYEIG